jgi:hypothetical protein
VGEPGASLSRFGMATRCWRVLILLLLGVALLGSSAASGGTNPDHASSHWVGATNSFPYQHELAPTGVTGVLTPARTDHAPPLSKLLCAVILALVVAVPLRRHVRRFDPAVVNQSPGPSIRRRGPPAVCFSAPF